MSDKDTSKKEKKTPEALKLFLLLILSIPVLALACLIIALLLGLAPFATIGFIFFQLFKLINNLHLRNKKVKLKKYKYNDTVFPTSRA